MLIQESRWIKNIIQQYVQDNSVILNIGSQTLYFRTKQQPFIQYNIFDLLDDKSCKTVHVDQQESEGVDEIGDVTNQIFMKKLQGYTPDLLICSNILEHLEDRKIFCNSLSQIMKAGSLLLVTGPYEFPYHEDPIDTMFRPTLEELSQEFSHLELVRGEIISCGNYRDLVWQKLTNGESLRKKLESVIKSGSFILKSTNKVKNRNHYKKLSAICALFKKI